MRLTELHTAIFTTLNAHVGLTALLATDPVGGGPAVFDHATQDSEFPYLVVGEPNGTEHDADDIQGWTGEIVIHSYCRERGFQEVMDIWRQTDDALHRQTPTVTDARIVTLHRESADSVLDADGLTRHGIHTFRVILDEL